MNDWLRQIEVCSNEKDTSCGNWTVQAKLDADSYLHNISFNGKKIDSSEFEKYIYDYWTIMQTRPSRSYEIWLNVIKLYRWYYFDADTNNFHLSDEKREMLNLKSYLYLNEIQRWPLNQTFRKNFSLNHYNFISEIFPSACTDTVTAAKLMNVIDAECQLVLRVDTSSQIRNLFVSVYLSAGSLFMQLKTPNAPDSTQCGWMSYCEIAFKKAIFYDPNNFVANYNLGWLYYNEFVVFFTSTPSSNDLKTFKVICNYTLFNLSEDANKFLGKANELKPDSVNPQVFSLLDGFISGK